MLTSYRLPSTTEEPTSEQKLAKKCVKEILPQKTGSSLDKITRKGTKKTNKPKRLFKDMKQELKAIFDELLFTFGSITTRSNLEKIATRYNFLDKLDSFSSTVENVLFGETKILDLEKTLTETLGVSEEVAQYIGIELDQDLFSNVRDEFNVAQGLMTPDEYFDKHGVENMIEQIEEEEALEAEAVESDIPIKTEVENVAVAEDPVAMSVLDNSEQSERRNDPYREPIE